MNPEITLGIYTIVGLVICSALAVLMMSLFSMRRIIAPWSSLMILVAVWIWLAGTMMEYLMPGLDVKILMNKFAYIGKCFLPAVWFFFCLQFSLRKRKLSPWWLLPVFVISAVLTFLVFTNNSHELMWHRPFLGPSGFNLEKDYHSGFLFFVTYSYTIVLVGFGILLASVFHRGRWWRRPIWLLIVAAVIPVTANIIDITLSRLLHGIDLTPISFAFSGFLAIYFVKLRTNNFLPAAQINLIEALPDRLFILSRNDHILYANPGAAELLGVERDELSGRKLTWYFPQFIDRIQTLETSDEPEPWEFSFGGRSFNVKLSTNRNLFRSVAARVLIMRDITSLKNTEDSLRKLSEELEKRVENRTMELDERNRELQSEIVIRESAELRLQNSLEEKSALLGEIHHRVKNNLQIISSLLKLQRNAASSADVKAVFQEAVSRIKCIALIHEKLYKSDDLGKISVRGYLQSLVQTIMNSHMPEHVVVQTQIDAVDIPLGIDASIHCGLIVNEFIVNSLKHAFPPGWEPENGRQACIRVVFARDGGDFVLSVEDNGIGLPSDAERRDGLGMKIVATLVAQLKGNLDRRISDGTTFFVRFPTRSETDLATSNE